MATFVMFFLSGAWMYTTDQSAQTASDIDEYGPDAVAQSRYTRFAQTRPRISIQTRST